jgi:hypothetical protein
MAPGDPRQRALPCAENVLAVLPFPAVLLAAKAREVLAASVAAQASGLHSGSAAPVWLVCLTAIPPGSGIGSRQRPGRGARRAEYRAEPLVLGEQAGALVLLYPEATIPLPTLPGNLPRRGFLNNREVRFLAVGASFAAGRGFPAGSTVGQRGEDSLPGLPAEKFRADDLRVMRSGRPQMLAERNYPRGR